MSVAVLSWYLPLGAAAETVEVAPGVQVTKKTYKAAPNEQPFFGFVQKTPEMRDADAKFVATIVSVAGSRERAFSETLRRGWVAFSADNFQDAARRFNQSYLIDPGQSGVYHGFGVVAHARFGDAEYSEELFRVAKKRPNPMPYLNADFGRLLLMTNRPREAQPILEDAVKEASDFATAWSNLAIARFLNGDRVGACAAAAEATRRPGATAMQSDLTGIRAQANCE